LRIEKLTTIERDTKLPIKEAIEAIYENGWNPETIKITEVDGTIKVKGPLTPMNWGMIKFELFCVGWSYDKTTKTFKLKDY
jgi:hypothetical protein